MYLAEDTLLRRRVAIKFPRDPNSPMDRLLQEARAASQLDHPNIARVLEAGTDDDGRLFVVMEYVEGQTLYEALNSGPIPISRARDIVAEILAALHQAHEHNIVHRDIKPANVVLSARGVKVLDFGLAKRFRIARPAAATASGDSTLSGTGFLTESGAIMGTPAYMSPEQLKGEPIDGRSDLFACGVVLYECLTGRRPFAGHGPSLHGAILHKEIEPVSRLVPGVDPALDAVVAKALSKAPADRYQSASEMAAALRPLVTGVSTVTTVLAPGQLPRRGWIGAAVFALVIAAAWWLTRPEPAEPAPSAQRWLQQGVESLRDGTYYSATRALEQLTAADPAFALGHARLAEAWLELDSQEKAQRELLLAKRNLGGWRRRAPAVDLTLSAIESLVLREYSAAASAYRRLLAETPNNAQAGVWLDLGRVQHKMNENAAAYESFSRAIALDVSYAAPWLLRGIVQGARQQFAPAAADFRKAQSIYEASQNFEGQAELAYQQGRLASLAKDLPAARVALERALELAAKSGDEFHQIRALSQLSVVTYQEGDPVAAQALASRALARARAARMPYLTVQAMVDVGNAQLSRLDLKSAEATLRQAAAIAIEDNLPRSEARARISLGSVLVQSTRDNEAIPEIVAALAFYEKGQMRFEINTGRRLLARVYRRRGDFNQVQQILSRILYDAETSADRSGAADALSEIAAVFTAEERFVEALRQHEKRYELVKESKAVGEVTSCLTGQAAMLMRLGALDQAAAKLKQAEARQGASSTAAKRLEYHRREFLFYRGDWLACQSANSEVLRKGGLTAEEELFSTARKVECLIFSGKSNEAAILASSIMPRALAAPSVHSAMWLRTVAASADADPKRALPALVQPIEFFRQRGQVESLWMAEAIAAEVSRRAHETKLSEAHSKASQAAWAENDVRMGPEYRAQYSMLGPVRQYRRFTSH